MTAVPATMRQLRSLVTADGELHLSIVETETPEPAPHEVLVRVEAAPINPSDLGLLLAGAEVDRARAGSSPAGPAVTAPLPPGSVDRLAARLGQSMTVGNEGAGTVVAAGDTPEAQALVGRLVGFAGGSSYGQYVAVGALFCMPAPDGTTAAQAASCFVNPLTSLGMIETMRGEGHTALVHTAAASNLGQMLNRLCLADGIGLVNVVRRPEQADLLRDQGAVHVCDTSAPGFTDDLAAAVATTGATLAFDAIGGGDLAGRILAAMEKSAAAQATGYSRYGSDVHKQVYIYGSLDPGPTTVDRSFGFAWGLGGWLLTPFLGTLALPDLLRLRQRVADELTTTFASHYTAEVSLDGALDLDAVRTYARQATGQKYLIRPDA
jgi:NADPH2:quinone reductase